jgi:dCMP deaminase
MVKQKELDIMYMEMAFAVAKRSHARRRKVGAIIVVPDGGRFEGINGMPSKFENSCEDEITNVLCEHAWLQDIMTGDYKCNKCQEKIDRVTLQIAHRSTLPEQAIETKLVTKAECLHAESNAIAKIARSTTSSVGGTMYCTLAPCLECAKLIIQAGIIRVVYAEVYPYPGHTGNLRPMGLELLGKAGIRVNNLVLRGHHVNDDELNLQDEGRHNDHEEWEGYSHP